MVADIVRLPPSNNIPDNDEDYRELLADYCWLCDIQLSRASERFGKENASDLARAMLSYAIHRISLNLGREQMVAALRLEAVRLEGLGTA